MKRIELLVEDANGNRGVFTATADTIAEAKSLAARDLPDCSVVKVLCLIDLEPQKALAF